MFKVCDNIASWNNQTLDGSAITCLRNLLTEYSVLPDPGGPPFQGGGMGVIHYEAASLFDVVPIVPGAPQIDLAFYDCVLAFDLAERRLYVVGKAHSSFVMPAEKPQLGHAAIVTEWQDSRTREAYKNEVSAVVEPICNGDIFQANLAHQFTGQSTFEPNAIDTYLALRAANPAPFSALLVDGDTFIASTSPERFLRLDGRHIETRPIKGTIRRYSDPALDLEQAQKLKTSEKDRAENTMIVDLLRNDLSRVAVPDSVQVDQLCAVESYERLHHLVSVVSAVLGDEYDALDLLAAAFPGGSITGAPKLKAMEIIANHEKKPRGVYCGAIGWIGFDGAMDLNNAIRTLVGRGRQMELNAGGGITLLSNPQAEYDETLLKAEAVMSALGSGIVIPPEEAPTNPVLEGSCK